jgi:hypothetical protein
MKRKKRLHALIGVGVVVLSFSCNKNETVVNSEGSGINRPLYASLENSFTYSINAKELSLHQTIPLTFTKSGLRIAAAVTNVTQGRAIFTLLNAPNGVVHADTFQRVGVSQVVNLRGLPSSASIVFQGFTGNIQYALIGDTVNSEFTVSDFPTQPFSSWVYAVYDSIHHQRDTLTLRIGDHTLIPGAGGISGTVWSFRYLGRMETLYVNISYDTLRFFHSTTIWATSDWQMNYLFPLTVGKTWSFGRGILNNVNRVLRTETIETPAGQFVNTVIVENVWSAVDISRWYRTWLAPRIGIVKFETGLSGMTAPEHKTWHLLQYRTY